MLKPTSYARSENPVSLPLPRENAVGRVNGGLSTEIPVGQTFQNRCLFFGVFSCLFSWVFYVIIGTSIGKSSNKVTEPPTPPRRKFLGSATPKPAQDCSLQLPRFGAIVPPAARC